MTRVQVVDPSAFTPPYDHALCTALARRGATVTLLTSRFAYGPVPLPEGYAVQYAFYRRAGGAPGSRRRQMSKLAEHLPDMLAARRLAHEADLVHFQWLDVPWLDRYLLPRRPTVLTAHDLLPREPRPGQVRAQRALYERVDAVIVHSRYGRGQLVDGLGVDPAKVHVVPHGAFDHLASLPDDGPLPPELPEPSGPVALFFGLLRPYKGIETLLAAWEGLSATTGSELWIAGRPRLPLAPLRAAAPAGVHFLPRFVADEELPALFRRADLVVLPYSRTERFDQSGVLATALAFGKPVVLTDVGGFSEIAEVGGALLVPPDDPAALHVELVRLLQDRPARERLAAGAAAAAAGPYSWDEAARRTLDVYRTVLGPTALFPAVDNPPA